jgi:hypothetical protein
MSLFEVPITPHSGGPRYALLRELSGREEAFATEPSPLVASELVGRLLAGAPADVWSLGVCDRDRLIAELYTRCYGDRIDATAPCRECGKSFAIGFSLDELLAGRVPSRPDGVEGPDEDGTYRLDGGCRFRLPTAADERAAALSPAEDAVRILLERCVVEGEIDASADALEQALEQLAPVLSLDLPARCPHCGLEQQVPFDMAQFFLLALMRERPLLTREVHYLASAYHWSHSEIIGLPRSERRAYVALVLAERAPPGAEGQLS